MRSAASVMHMALTIATTPMAMSSSLMMEEFGDCFRAKEEEETGEIMRSMSGSAKLWKRPSKLLLPKYSPSLDFDEGNCCRIMRAEDEQREMEMKMEGRDFFVVSKKGLRKESLEDGYVVMHDILGDPKQAFFVVIDGHGGRAAVDYVSQNLGKNIVKELENVGNTAENHQLELEAAIRRGYLTTDSEFLLQGMKGGACAASVYLRDEEIHVANLGDCRVVLSRQGTAITLTSDHRVSREDERLRIENSGGYVHCQNGVWRVNGSLAVSRAFGNLNMKKWVISEPEIEKLTSTSDCEFLIIASDGLWDKVGDQEAVDVILRNENLLDSSRKLIDISTSRGNLDDVTIMIINLHKFVSS